MKIDLSKTGDMSIAQVHSFTGNSYWCWVWSNGYWIRDKYGKLPREIGICSTEKRDNTSVPEEEIDAWYEAFHQHRQLEAILGHAGRSSTRRTL